MIPTIFKLYLVHKFFIIFKNKITVGDPRLVLSVEFIDAESISFIFKFYLRRKQSYNHVSDKCYQSAFVANGHYLVVVICILNSEI